MEETHTISWMSARGTGSFGACFDKPLTTKDKLELRKQARRASQELMFSVGGYTWKLMLTLDEDKRESFKERLLSVHDSFDNVSSISISRHD